jgi:hypothetical protein
VQFDDKRSQMKAGEAGARETFQITAAALSRLSFFES